LRPAEKQIRCSYNQKEKPWITVTKLAPQPEPRNLTGLKAEVGRRWGQLFLFDVLKEAALQTLLWENVCRYSYCTGSSELPQHTPAPEANEMGQPEVL
jgi:hypothetical protein